MAGVLNKTARPYNLKARCPKKKTIVKMALNPGFNIVDNAHWDVLKNDPYVKRLKDDEKIVFGKKQDETELERDGDTKTVSKEVKIHNKNNIKAVEM